MIMERVSIRHGLQHYRLSDMSKNFRYEYSGQEYHNIQMLQLCWDIEQERERERELLILQRASNLREFVKTHVILAPLREFSRSRAASKIPFPGAQPGKAGEFQIFHFRCKNRYLRSRVI